MFCRVRFKRSLSLVLGAKQFLRKQGEGINAMSRRMRSSNKSHRMFDCSHNRLRVLVDMDQVLCDFEGRFLAIYREKFPDEPFIPFEQRNTFFIVDQYEKLKADLPVCYFSF